MIPAVKHHLGNVASEKITKPQTACHPIKLTYFWKRKRVNRAVKDVTPIGDVVPGWAVGVHVCKSICRKFAISSM